MNPPSLESLRLLTWNLWFDEYMQIERLLAVLSYVEPLRPHVVAFQEMTLTTQHVLQLPKIPFSQYYREIPAEVPPKQWYWEALYSRIPAAYESSRLAYSSSEMGRGLTVLLYPDYDLLIGCTHLESEHEHPSRRRQLAEALQHLESFGVENMFLLGDMNTRSSQHLDDLLPETWHDAWLTLRPNDPGYTVDSTRNLMIPRRARHRLDRIFFKSKRWQPKTIRLVGEHVLTSETQDRFFPSDHFGLFLECVPTTGA